MSHDCDHFVSEKKFNFVINWTVKIEGILLVQVTYIYIYIYYSSDVYSDKWAKIGRCLGIWLGNNCAIFHL